MAFSLFYFVAFSRIFHGFIIAANLEGTPSIFQAWDICGGGALIG